MLHPFRRGSDAPSNRRRLPVVALILTVVAGGLAASRTASAGPSTSGGYTTSATASPATVRRGGIVTLSVTVTSSTSRTGLVDLEVYAGSSKRYQRAWDRQSFTAGVARTFSTSWTVPTGEPLGAHTVKVGVFASGWASLAHWNDSAASLAVDVATTTTTTGPATTTTVAPTTVAPTTTTTASSGRFATRPVGASLPSGATCAGQVRPVAENRPGNATPNATVGTRANATYPRVDGQYRGTTDQILQWVACKWGIDEDIVRAQIAVESWWHQSTVGDNGESFGLGQVRVPYHQSAFVDDNAKRSSAYNVDYTYAVFRSCYEGQMTWLNTVERGATYVAGDLWGCIGVWFSGRWHTPAAEGYIAKVQDYLAQRVWASTSFDG